MKINKFIVGCSLAYVFMNCINEQDYEDIAQILMHKYSSILPLYKSSLQKLNMILEDNKTAVTKSDFLDLDQRIKNVKAEIERVDSRELAHLFNTHHPSRK